MGSSNEPAGESEARASKLTAVAQAAPVFAALGDPTRLELVTHLSSTGPGSISALSQRVSVSRQAVTKHLKVLAGAHLVRSERRGRERIWELAPQRLEDAVGYLKRIDAQWEAALSRLADFLDE